MNGSHLPKNLPGRSFLVGRAENILEKKSSAADTGVLAVVHIPATVWLV